MVSVPLDGRITSLDVLDLPLLGDEVQEIVSPGNESQGNSYQVTTEVLAAFYASYGALNGVILTSGASLLVPYAVTADATRVLFNKSVGAASYAVLGLAADQAPYGILFKDLKGDAASHNITISFTSGELCEGSSTVVISTNYGFKTINAIPSGGGWYLT